MKGFASWFVGKGEEENKVLAIMKDTSKSWKKRFGALLQIVKHFDKPNPDRASEFIKSNFATAIDICTNYLRNESTKTKGRSAWEEVITIIKCFIDITKYKIHPLIDVIQDIASACLNDSNRWELRDLGFSLLLNILNLDMSLDVPNFLMLASIDFSQIKSEENKGSSYFPDRSILSNPPSAVDFQWVSLFKTTDKGSDAIQSKNLEAIEKISGNGLSKGARDCIFFLYKVLEYSTNPDVQQRTDHFSKWFYMLKGTILYLLYPNLCSPSEKMGNDFGFREMLPPILHYIIVKWIFGCIKQSDLNSVLLQNPSDFKFITTVIGQSFYLTESYSTFCYESASISIKLYEEWMFQRFITEDFKKNWSKTMENLLNYSILLFDFTQDTSPRRISLCKEFLKMLEKSKEKNSDQTVILNCALKLASKTLETHPKNKSPQDIIELIAEFLIKLLADCMNLSEVNWTSFADILKVWSAKSECIIERWLEVMKAKTSYLKEIQFMQGISFNGWLQLLQVLGDPLTFTEKVQIKWAKSYQELIIQILSPAHLSPKPNFLLEIFFMTLSKLIRQGAKESQIIALNSLVSIFALSKCEEMPMQCYLQHLSLLLYLSSKSAHLHTSVLDASYKVLDYPGMHFLITTFLKQSSVYRSNSLKFIFYIMFLPNYFGKTKLENIEEADLTYADLKPQVQDLLEKCVNDPDISVSALYGFTVFILEELDSGNENVSDLVTSIIQNKCLSENEDTAITALHCLQILSSSFPNLSKSILDFLISRCLSDIPNTKEKVVKAVLNTIQNWVLVNNSTPCEGYLLSNLFKNLSLKLSTLEPSSTLESEINTLVSFISIYYLNFPFKNHNSTVFNSIITDEEFSGNSSIKPLHFALGQSVIFSMIPNAEKAKFVLRNQFGRFCWEAYDFMIFEPSTNTEEVEKALNLMKEAKISLNVKEPPSPLHDEPLLPKLISYISESYPECYIPEKNIEAGSEILRLIDSVEKMESECKFEEKVFEKEKIQFNMCRYFVANFGLIDKLVLLQSCENFDRALGILDTMKPRESVKIGVIYVAPGQQDEKEILANTGGSVEFQEFLQELGEVVDIREHQGNLGGLDPSGSAGTISIAYADWQYDVMFHIVPLMPTDQTDDQLVSKKRHVGNDIVHIVWSDHWRDYRHDTMLTHFNFIIIVIYPLTAGIFRIQILKKINVDCGPLQDGMVVPAHLLPSLVRQTAIHANQQIRFVKHPNYEKQTQQRKKNIQEIITRYPAQQIQKHQVYASMF